MTKTKKLLSVLLAVVLVLSSFTIMGSAAKTSYQTVDNLTALGAYSPYGQVTRLSTEERTSIVFDALDNLLPSLNINMGEVFNVLGLSVTIDLTSIDRLCYSFDTIKDTFENTLASIAMAIVDLGILESLETGKWTTGMTRDGTAQYTILSTLLAFLSDNTTLVGKVFTDGLDLGLVSLGDMSAVEDIIMDLPGLIKGLVYPMLERWDDTVEEIKNLDTWGSGNGNVVATLNWFLPSLLTNDMSHTTIKYDVNGNMTSEHTKMPITTTAPSTTTAQTSGSRCVYVVTGTTPGSTMTIYHIVDAAEAKALAKDNDDTNDQAAYTYIKQDGFFTLEEEVEGSGVYVWKAYETDKSGNFVLDENGEKKYTSTLKWYNDESPLLPQLKTAIDNGEFTLDLANDNISAGDLFYDAIPIVFESMAPVVLNGSVKKLLGGLFGAKYNYVGLVGENAEADDEAAIAALPDAGNAFFTQEQGDYVFEWSDYAVINGNHYYRFEDQIYAADLSNTNEYFDIIDWEYNIDGDFLDEFVPANDDSASDRLLLNFNKFLYKLVNTAFTDEFVAEIETKYGALSNGDNSNFIPNVKKVAQTFIQKAPEDIFGSDYATNERCYYNLLISEDNDTVLTGIAAQLVDMIMPSMTLPGASDILASNAKVGAILAAVIREFAAKIIPEYNYDALIYADYGTTSADKVKTFVDPEAKGLVTEGSTASGYWFDVILTIGLDAGYEYIRAFADIGEDSTEVQGGVINVGYKHAGGEYAANTTQAALNAQWEAELDYIIDWALTTDKEWTWKMANLVDVSSLTVDLATAQDPFAKLDVILLDETVGLLPILNEVLTINTTDSTSKVEQFLRYDLILGIVDLEWDELVDTLAFNGTNKYFRSGNILQQLATLLKKLVNGIFGYVGRNGSTRFEFIPSVITDFDSLANQSNIVTLVKNLVGVLYRAMITNGLADTVFPFLNFFLGCKTDPQTMADPQMWTAFRDGNDYAFQYNISAGGAIDSANTVIKILNNSAGMLETHRDSTITDHAYDINIRSITSDASVNTLTFSINGVTPSASSPVVIAPYQQASINIGGTFNADEAVTMVVEYDFVGKDGNPVGGTQYTSLTFLVSNLYEDSNLSTCQSDDHDKDYTGLTDVKGYVFTEDVFSTALNYTAEIHYVKASTGNSDKSFASCQPEGYSAATSCSAGSEGKVPQGTAATYFAQYTGQAGGWADKLQESGTTSTTAYLYYALDGTTRDDAATIAAKEESMPYGAYDMGEIGVKYGSDTKVIIVDFIHYNDFDIGDVWAEFKDKGLTVNDIDTTDASAVAAYNAYNTALKKIAYLATYPMMTTSRSTANWEGVTAQGTSSNDYVTVIQPQIEDAIDALIGVDNEDGTHVDGAWDTLETYLANAQGSAGADADLPTFVADLETVLANDGWAMNPSLVETAKANDEIDYTDYEFYEYFNYADRRTAARNLVATYYAPEVMDTYYILGSGIGEAELNDVIAAEANEYIAAGIEATKMENDAAAVAASIEARDAWKQPTTSELAIDDIVANLAYYEQFALNKPENDDVLVFLNKEIQHVEAQGFVEADYTADTWEAYADALADAKTIAAAAETGNEKNSQLFEAKWNLMVARKNLLKKADSVLTLNGEEIQNLQALADQANVIFDNIGTYYAVKEGEDVNKAYAALITALGYEYVGEDGNTWNLYADSALEYLNNDRPNRKSNLNNINASADALKKAIDKFECTIKLEETDSGKAAVDQEVKYINGITPGSIATVADLLNHVKASVEGANLVANASKAGAMGTGAYVDVTVDGIDGVLAVYYVVIYGDVNGDGAIDTFDAMEVDIKEAKDFGIAYRDAADVTGDDQIGDADYAAIIAASAAGAPIAQTK